MDSPKPSTPSPKVTVQTEEEKYGTLLDSDSRVDLLPSTPAAFRPLLLHPHVKARIQPYIQGTRTVTYLGSQISLLHDDTLLGYFRVPFKAVQRETSRHSPHQGNQEKARRVKQMNRGH